MELDTDLESFVSYLRTLSTFRAHQARVGSEAAEMLVRSFVSRYRFLYFLATFAFHFLFLPRPVCWKPWRKSGAPTGRRSP